MYVSANHLGIALQTEIPVSHTVNSIPIEDTFKYSFHA